MTFSSEIYIICVCVCVRETAIQDGDYFDGFGGIVCRWKQTPRFFIQHLPSIIARLDVASFFQSFFLVNYYYYYYSVNHIYVLFFG